ncbi:MAG TPA: PilN domain-containing protein [Verrucomicrobium sp.]|nr:PilN domain-containing protein [Verrucomicrobium sp.]
MSSGAASFLIPDSQLSWRLWKSASATSSEQVEAPATCRETSKPMVVGLPATACRTIGLILPNVEAALLPAMIEAQLERRGVVVETAPTANFAWHVLTKTPTDTLVSVDVLAQPFPTDLAVNHASKYTAALRLLTLPPGELVVVEEQGMLVLAANQAGKLWHSHIVGSIELGAVDLARELELARLSLEAQEGFGALRGATLVGAHLGSLRTELRKHTPMNLEHVATLQPNRTQNLDAFPKLLPVPVFQAQASKEKRRRVLSVLALLVMIYAVVCAMAWWYLQQLQSDAAIAENNASAIKGPAADVRATAQRWRTLEGATDVQRYPMVQLSHITNLMPPSGIVLKRFEAKLTEVDLRGEARDAQSATQFLEDLKKHPTLSRYTWAMPTPTMKDKVASFRIQGKLEGA